MILNVNVPDRPYDDAARHRGDPTGISSSFRAVSCARKIRKGDQSTGSVPPGRNRKLGQARISMPSPNGFVSVTPLQIDLTRHATIEAVGEWLRGMMIDSRLNGIGMTSARTRERLVQRLKDSGIRNPVVLDRIRSVPRHLFVDEAIASRAYEDVALTHRVRSDHFSTMDRRSHDRGADRGRARRRRCWRSALVVAIRRRCLRRWWAGSTRSSAWNRCMSARANGSRCWDSKCPPEAWRRREGLADPGAVRWHPGCRRSARRARCVAQATGAGWANDRSDWLGGRAGAGAHHARGRSHEARDDWVQSPSSR